MKKAFIAKVIALGCLVSLSGCDDTQITRNEDLCASLYELEKPNLALDYCKGAISTNKDSVTANYYLGMLNKLDAKGKNNFVLDKRIKFAADNGFELALVEVVIDAFTNPKFKDAKLTRKEVITSLENRAKADKNFAILPNVIAESYIASHSQIPHDNKKSFEFRLLAAQRGNVDAILALANYYYTGIGTKADFAKAMEVVGQLARKNEPSALVLQSFFKLTNLPKAKDPKKEVLAIESMLTKVLNQAKQKEVNYKNYLPIQDNENPLSLAQELKYKTMANNSLNLATTKAFEMLCDIYEGKYDTAKHKFTDDAKRTKLLERGIDLDITRAKTKLGVDLLFGDNVEEKSAKQGLKYINEAIIANDAYAYYVMSEVYEKGIPSLVVKDLNKALAYLLRSSNLGYEDAKIRLANYYQQGRIVSRNYESMLNLHMELLNNYHNSNSAIIIGNAYRDGIVVSKNAQEAIKYYQRAVALNNVYGLVSLINMYLTTNYGTQDVAKARKLLEQSHLQDKAIGKLMLATSYIQGVAEDFDNYKAVTLLKEAIDLGSIEAVVKLGGMYMHGYGVDKDYNKAKILYLEGLNQGWQNARFDLYNLAKLRKNKAEEHAWLKIIGTCGIAIDDELATLSKELKRKDKKRAQELFKEYQEKYSCK